MGHVGLKTLTMVVSAIFVSMPSSVFAAPKECSVALETQAELGQTSLFRAFGFTHLHHKTRFEALPSILKSGLRSNKYSIGDPSSVFFWMKKRPINQIQFDTLDFSRSSSRISEDGIDGYLSSGGLRSAIVEVDLEALESRDFHIAKFGQKYGIRERGDYVSTPTGPDLASLEKFLTGRSREERKNNRLYGEGRVNELGEVVVKGKIPLRFIKSVQVPEVHFDEAIEALKRKGVSKVNGIPIEEFVVPIPIMGRVRIHENGDVTVFQPQ